eukprot:COSAG01_NODE_14386_length_1461_cov_0.811307_2_plen_164_part_01
MPHVTAAAMATNGVSSSSLTTIGGGGVAGGGGGTAGVVVVVEMIGACVMSGVPATFALVPIVCMSAAVTCEPNCNTVTAPAGGQMGTCTGSLVSGGTCQPVCSTGYDHPAPTQCDGGVVTVDVCRPSSCTPTAPPSNGALNGALGSCPSPMAHGAVCVPVCADG